MRNHDYKSGHDRKIMAASFRARWQALGLPVRAGIVVDPGIRAIPQREHIQQHEGGDDAKQNEGFHSIASRKQMNLTAM
jgi:hypothetical protein